MIGYDVKIFSKPTYNQDITVRTWSRDYNPAFAVREFEVLSDTGVVLAVANSQFVRYDITANKLQKITDTLMLPYETERDRSNFGMGTLSRFVAPTTYDGCVEYIVDWRWIDLNRHLNNAHYVDLANKVISDAYGVDLGDTSFRITYKAQIKEGDRVKCYYLKSDDTYTVVFKSFDDKVVHGGISFYKTVQ